MRGQLIAIDFGFRSSLDKRYGVPRVPAHGVSIKYVDGRPTISGTPLANYGVPARNSVVNPLSSQNNGEPGQAIYNPGMYGDALSIPFIMAAAGEFLALRRTQQTRIELLIQNVNIAGGVGYAFNRAADATTCIVIPNGGNRLWDSVVPQGDLHLFASGAGTIIVEFMNQNIVTPANVV